jgi:hypothetical protein
MKQAANDQYGLMSPPQAAGLNGSFDISEVKFK